MGVQRSPLYKLLFIVSTWSSGLPTGMEVTRCTIKHTKSKLGRGPFAPGAQSPACLAHEINFNHHLTASAQNLHLLTEQVKTP